MRNEIQATIIRYRPLHHFPAVYAGPTLSNAHHNTFNTCLQISSKQTLQHYFSRIIILLPVHFSLGVYICYYTGWKERSIFREKSDLEVRAAGSGGAGKQCKVSMQWCLCIGGTERIISGVKIQVGVK